MNTEPLTIALREITDTRRLLQGLLTSSESFDYVAAKDILKALQRKVRRMAKLQSQLEAPKQPGRMSAPNILAVDFSKAAQPPRSQGR